MDVREAFGATTITLIIKVTSMQGPGTGTIRTKINKYVASLPLDPLDRLRYFIVTLPGPSI